MKKGLKTLIIIVIIIGLVVVGGYIALQQLGGDLDDIVVENIDLSAIADGTYIGEYATTLVSAKVEVTVVDGQIIDIVILEHDHGANHGAYDVVQYIVDDQALNVDTISGATTSSKVIMKAVEDAFLNSK